MQGKVVEGACKEGMAQKWEEIKKDSLKPNLNMVSI